MGDKTDSMKNVKVTLSGKVQGVWFRAWTREQAEKRGLDGWVRNREDGSVEAQIYGPEDKVDDMLSAIEQGPSRAEVKDLDVTNASHVPDKGFYQRPTV